MLRQPSYWRTTDPVSLGIRPASSRDVRRPVGSLIGFVPWSATRTKGKGQRVSGNRIGPGKRLASGDPVLAPKSRLLPCNAFTGALGGVWAEPALRCWSHVQPAFFVATIPTVATISFPSPRRLSIALLRAGVLSRCGEAA